MPTTLPVPFDHHATRSGRLDFAEWAGSSNCSGFSNDPVFRYGRDFDESIVELRALAASQRDIFLSNIVMHSSVFTKRDGYDPKGDLAFAYQDVESLIRSPTAIGYNIVGVSVADGLTPVQNWQVICGEHSFDDSPAEAGLDQLEVIGRPSKRFNFEKVVHCRLSDAKQFCANWINICFDAYFIPPSAKLDLNVVADRFRREELTSYLLRKDMEFGTLGDCHMDDDIAVSYRSNVFGFSDTNRCFIR